MSHCEEPNEAGGCTNCGKCGKGRIEIQREDFPIDVVEDNSLTRRNSILPQSFTSDTRAPKRLPVLNNTGPQMPSAPESATFANWVEMRNRE